MTSAADAQRIRELEARVAELEQAYTPVDRDEIETWALRMEDRIGKLEKQVLSLSARVTALATHRDKADAA